MAFREAVLASLKRNQGEWISGEKLSDDLKVSRTTIWKQVKTLQAEGYRVDSSPKKGYRLAAAQDLLSAGEVLSGLKSRVLGQTHYFYYSEIDSTNNRARELAARGYPEGTVVVAEKQTGGRGRRGRSWSSAAGQGLYVSVIFRPVLPLKEISRISLVTAEAVAETLEKELNLPARIKWPNDILIRNRKICGILTEAVTDMDGVEYLVSGIGININNRSSDFPEELRNTATSCLIECGQPQSRIKILQGLLACLELNYHHLLQGGFTDILEKIKCRSSVIGQELRLDTLNGWLTGRAVDIDDNGFLLIRDPAGAIHTVMSGEISLLTLPEKNEQ